MTSKRGHHYSRHRRITSTGAGPALFALARSPSVVAMLPSYTCVSPARLYTAIIKSTSYRTGPWKAGTGSTREFLPRPQSRSLATVSRSKYGKDAKTRYNPKRKAAEDLRKQMETDRKIGQPSQPSTGPEGASKRARASSAKSPRYPESFLEETQAMEADSKAHLEEIKRHFTENLELHFDDWELVQAALTHYSIMGARRSNDALSRVGEKVLRFLLVTEIQNLEPQASKQAWFLQTNLRFLTRFEFLATYIDSTLQIGPLVKARGLTEEGARRSGILGNDAVQYQHSVVAKSVLALIGALYKSMGEEQTRLIVRTLFIEPYRDESGRFQAPVLQPLQVKQTGGL